MPTSDAACRAAKLCAGAVPRPWLLRNRMSELFTYGSVGVAGHSLWSYGDRGKARLYPEADGETPPLSADRSAPQQNAVRNING